MRATSVKSAGAAKQHTAVRFLSHSGRRTLLYHGALRIRLAPTPSRARLSSYRLFFPVFTQPRREHHIHAHAPVEEAVALTAAVLGAEAFRETALSAASQESLHDSFRVLNFSHFEQANYRQELAI